MFDIRHALLRSTAVLLLAWTGLQMAHAAPGDLDTSFGIAGAATAHARTFGAEVAAVAWDGDMVLVAATSRRNDGYGQGPAEFRIVLRRYLSDGTLDASFGAGGEAVLGVVPTVGGNQSAWMQTGPRHVRIASRDSASGGPAYVVYADVEGNTDAILYWGMAFDGQAVDYAAFLPYVPPSPVSSALVEQTIGALAVTAAGDVVIAGTVRYNDAERIYVRTLPRGVPGASGDAQFLVTGFESRSVTGLALDEANGRYYVSATPYDPVTFNDQGSVVVAVAPDLSGLATGFNGTGVKSLGGDESAGVVVVPGTPAKVRAATLDRTTGYYRLIQVDDAGTTDTGYGTAGVAQHAMGGGFARASGLVRPATGAVLAVTDAGQFGYWRTSDTGVDLGLTIPGFTGGVSGAASAIAALDDKVAVGGLVVDAVDRRFNAITVFDDQGVLDTVFGGGLVQAAGSTKAPLSAQAMVRQSNGRLVAGTISCSSEPLPPLAPPAPPCKLVLQGYTAAGAVDTSFGVSSGRVEFPLGSDDSAPRLWLALGPSDQIVAAYQGFDPAAQRDQLVIVRHGADGNPLLADRAGGATRPDWDVVQGLAVDTTGRAFVLFNRWTAATSSPHLAVAARSAAGGPDASFGAGGVFVSSGFPSGDDEGFGIATDASNRVVVAGWRRGPNDPLVVRLTAAGQLDTAFNATGYRTQVPGYATGLLHAPAVSGTGTIYVAGNGLGSRLRNFVAAYKDDGQSEGGFAGCGVADLPYYAGRASKVTLDAPNYLLVSGFASTVRMGLAGALDLQFGEQWGPWAPVQNPGLTYPTTSGTVATYAEVRGAFDAAVVPGGYAVAHPYLRRDIYEGMSVAKYLGGGGARATVTLTGPSAVTVGTPAAYTASVSAGKGAITFRFGCPSDGETWPLAAGSVTLSHTFTVPGTYTVTAVHEGDDRRAPAIAAPLVVTVTAGGAATTTALAAPATSVFGQSVHLAATVAPGAATGSVTFRDGTAVIGTSPVTAGSASLDIATLAVGAHTLTAEYGGDGAYAASTSAPVALTVGQASTSTSLGAAPASPRFGEPVTLTATVTTLAPSTAPPMGAVAFREGATLLGGATLDATGKATLALAGLSVGSHPIVADYQGTGTHLASAGGATVSVAKADTAATLVAPPAPVYGQSATLTATVSAVAPGSGVPQGTVQFAEGGPIGAPVSLDAAGSASVAWTPLTPGAVTLSAAYAGSNDFNATTKAVAATVALGVTSATVSTVPTTVVAGSPASLRVRIVKVGAGAAPTGSVVFTVDGVTLGSAGLDASGTASLPYTAASGGVKTLNWTYLGDTRYALSNGSSTFTVLGPGDLVVTVFDGNNQTAARGAQFPQLLRVKVTTAAGAPVANYPLTFTTEAHPVSGAVAILDATSVQTDPIGLASVTATASTVGLGAHRVRVNGLANVYFDLLTWEAGLTTTNPSITVTPIAGRPVTVVEATNVVPPTPLPAGASFPYGLVGFTLEGLTPGATVQVTLTFPGNLAGTTYYKYRNGGYFPMPGASVSGNSVVLTLVDGGAGDADGIADGRIVDPGGPAVVAAVGVPVTPVPTLSEGALALLAAMMLGFGAVAARRRATLPASKVPPRRHG
ncbi:MAG: IPTL-CTERM sorting domain-containing protein [Burkholderiales bacterium]